MKYTFEQAGKSIEIDVEQSASGYVLRGPDGAPQLIRLERHADGSQRAITPWGELTLVSARRGAEVWAQAGGRRSAARVERARPSAGAGSNGSRAGAVCAPMAGKLLRVEVALGDRVRAGQALAVIEAMKMENELLAPFAGEVAEVAATAPGPIDKGALVVRLEPT